MSDQTVPFIYSETVRETFADVEAILGCGDLPADYLDFVISMLDVPLYYVPGNHDPDDYEIPGGECIDGRLVRRGGLWLAGLGGSRRYKPQGRHQYSEVGMGLRVLRLALRALPLRLLRGTGVDILLTHAPPRGVHDRQDEAHVGFASFHMLLRLVRPRLVLHGHIHLHPNIDTVSSELYGSRVLSVFPYRRVTYPPPALG